MRILSLTIACLCAVVIGVGQAMDDVTQPVGFVSEMHCKRPEKPCTNYNIKVQS